jgi:hypothetical protein
MSEMQRGLEVEIKIVDALIRETSICTEVGVWCLLGILGPRIIRFRVVGSRIPRFGVF